MPLTRRNLLLSPCAMFATPGAVHANDASALAKTVHDRPSGKDLTLVTRMELSEGGRPPRVRRMVSYRLRHDSGEVAYLVRFLEPRDIAGVALLSSTRPDEDTEQSLYLPELGRSRKVAGNRKGGRFVGSDLYFEDLEERSPSRDKHRIIGREVIGSVACDVLESIPIRPDDSVYQRRVSWIDAAVPLPLRVDYFEADAQRPAKRWLLQRQQRVQGFQTVMESSMTDLGQGSETRLFVESARYDRKLPDRLFTSRALADERYESEFRP